MFGWASARLGTAGALSRAAATLRLACLVELCTPRLAVALEEAAAGSAAAAAGGGAAAVDAPQPLPLPLPLPLPPLAAAQAAVPPLQLPPRAWPCVRPLDGLEDLVLCLLHY